MRVKGKTILGAGIQHGSWTALEDCIEEKLPGLTYPLDLSAQWTVLTLTKKDAELMVRDYRSGAYLLYKTENAGCVRVVANITGNLQHFTFKVKYSNNYYFHQYLYLNLQDSAGQLLFDADGIKTKSITEFFHAEQVKQQFKYWIGRSISGVFNLTVSSSLADCALKNILSETSDLKWLQNTPKYYHEKILLRFLDLFINHVAQSSGLVDWLEKSLYLSNKIRLTYRRHYSVEEVHAKINALRWLCQNGNSAAAKVLAAILYSGLTEEQPVSSQFFSGSQRPTPIALDLEEFKQITQNPLLFPNKLDRDLLLVKYLEAKMDSGINQFYIDQIDFPQLVSVCNEYCSDYLIYSLMSGHEGRILLQFINTPHVLHTLISQQRLYLLKQVMPLVSRQKLDEQDELGNTVEQRITEMKQAGQEVFGSALIVAVYDAMQNLLNGQEEHHRVRPSK